MYILQDQTYWAWSVCDQNVLDVLWIHWELAWMIMSKIGHSDYKICTDLQHRSCIVQDQTYWTGSVRDQNVQDVLCVHWELVWIIMSKIRHADCKICTDLQHRMCIVQDQTYWAGSVHDENVQDVLCVHRELVWIIMSKIRHADCKICTDLQHIKSIVQDQTYWAWSVYYQNVLDVLYDH